MNNRQVIKNDSKSWKFLPVKKQKQLIQPQPQRQPLNNKHKLPNSVTNFLSQLRVFSTSFGKQGQGHVLNFKAPIPPPPPLPAIQVKAFSFKKHQKEPFEKWLEIKALSVQNEFGKIKERHMGLQHDAKLRPEKKLNIAKNPYTGPFGVSAVAFLFSATFFTFWRRKERRHWL